MMVEVALLFLAQPRRSGAGSIAERACGDSCEQEWMHPLGKRTALPWTRLWGLMLEHGSKHSQLSADQAGLHAIGRLVEEGLLDQFAALLC